LAGNAALKSTAPVFAALADERPVLRWAGVHRPADRRHARESLDAISRQWDEALGRLKAFVER